MNAKPNAPSKGQPSIDTYEVSAFAVKFGVPPSEAKTIIKRYGSSKKKLDAHMAARSA